MEADFIVVGAGSAGCVVAAELAADANSRVILTEAGGAARGPLFSVPLATGILLRSKIANWAYVSEPQAHLADRRIKWPRGRGLGGSSAINGMVYMRGLPGDFERWGLTDQGWGWADVRPVFERIEARLKPSRGTLAHPFYQTFIEAAISAGHRRTEAFNGDRPEGAGAYDFMIRAGKRISAASAFLKDRPPNLAIHLREQVVRLLIEQGRCTGVVTRRGILRARREVILAAGTVGSPQLLMLSGIGPAEHLRAHGIAVASDVAGVGENLQDHLLVRVMHATPYPETVDALRRVDRALLAGARAWMTGTGPAATFPIEVGGLFKSDPAIDEPDLQASFMPGLSTATLRLPFAGMSELPGRERGYFANIFQMRPESRGHIRLASADPFAHPLISPNYLSTDGDMAVLRAGVKRLRDIFGQAAWGDWRGPELQPGPDVRSDGEIDSFIRQTADTVFHPVGTCRMGTESDPLAVVDAQLRVRGIEGLRVADASVMPAITSCNTAAPTMMIGARAADFILAKRNPSP